MTKSLGKAGSEAQVVPSLSEARLTEAIEDKDEKPLQGVEDDKGHVHRQTDIFDDGEVADHPGETE